LELNFFLHKPGCFGYFDTDDKLLVTYYVADAHGYRLIEANKPAKIYPVVADPKYVVPFLLVSCISF
jgi:hypothetical protein